MEDPKDQLRDRVVGALGAVLAVALVIGGVAGAVAYGAVRAAGLGDDTTVAARAPRSHAPSSPPSTGAPAPSGSPSATRPPRSGDTGTAHRTPEPEKTPSAEHRRGHAHNHKSSHKNHRADAGGTLTLTAGPRHVSSMGRINLFGRYAGHGGARLEVQRREGGSWTRFPVSTTVRGGSFRTWVASGHHGRNQFRVVDPAMGRASAPVTVFVS